MRGTRFRTVLRCTAFAVMIALVPARGIAQTPSRKADAIVHFKKGVVLSHQGAWTEALAEFLEARKLYPLRNASGNAGYCLEALRRYDEALTMYEDMLREFGDTMPVKDKEEVQGKVIELRGLVGEI